MNSIVKVIDETTSQLRRYEDSHQSPLAIMCQDDMLRLTPKGEDFGLKISQNKLMTKNNELAF